MKKLLSMLLVMCMVISMLPLAVFAEEVVVPLLEDGDTISGTDVAVSTNNYGDVVALNVPFKVVADGILTVRVLGAKDANGNDCAWGFTSTLALMKKGQGEATHEFEVTAGTEHYIDIGPYINYGYAVGTVSYEISFKVQELETQKETYIITENVLNADGDSVGVIETEGTYTVNMEENAEMTVVPVTPAQTGVYSISVPAGTALLNKVGAGSYFIYEWNEETASASVEWTCEEVYGVIRDDGSVSQGQSLMLGIKSENASVQVTLNKTGEYEAEVIEEVIYENKAVLSQYELPEDAVLGSYVNVMDTEDHSAVLGADGYYHLDSADGPVLLLDMVYNNVILTEKLKSEVPTMYVYIKQEGANTIKYDIADAVQEYESVCCVVYDEDGKTVLGKYYPLTEDLQFFYKEYATAQGLWNFNGLETTEESNADAWMYCCRVMYTGDTAMEGTLRVGVDGANWTAIQTGTVYFTAEPATLAVDITTEEDTDTVLYTIQDGVGQYDVDKDTAYTFWLPVDYEGDEVITVIWTYAAPAGDEDDIPEGDCEHSYFYACDRYCSECGELTNPDAAHTITKVEAVEATCSAEGNVEYWTCSDCGNCWLDEGLTQQTNRMNVVTFAEHTYVYACDAYCNECGEKTNPDATHTITKVEAVEATCTANGNREFWTCSDCGCCWLDEALRRQTNRMSVVTYKDHEYFYACDGYCMNCGELTNPDAAHTITKVEAVEATCSANGNVEYWTCSDCGSCWLDEALMRQTNRMSVVTYKDHEYFYPCDTVCMLCGEETNPDAQHTVEHVEAKAATCAEAGNLEYWYCTQCGAAWLDEAGMLNTNVKAVILPKLEAVAAIGDSQYASVSEALAAAKSGETVSLIADATDSYIIITPGVTLNLGAYDLTADYVIGLKGSKLTGDRYRSTADYAKLIVAKENVVLSSDPFFNSSNFAMLPIWMETEGCYQFMQCFFQNMEASAAEGTMTLKFEPATNTTESGLFAANGVDDYGLSIIVRVSYAEEQSAGDVLVSKEYFYTEDLVKNSFQSRARMTVSMGGCDELKDLVFTMAVVSDTGIVYNSASYAYAVLGSGPNPFAPA